VAEPAASPLSTIELSALLTEFAAAPGNFLVRLGEPKALFARIDTLAAWAVGRTPPELSDQADQLRDAAVLFVLRACFAADNTHYQVLGMSPKALTAESLRIRYRALIRLTHPDMGVQGLPANAAGIVNRANEVLGDPELRSRYDDLLASRKTLARGDPGATRAPQIELRANWRERWQSLVARFPTAVWAVPGALVALLMGLVLVIWASTGANDSRMLIVAREDDAPPERDSPRNKPQKGKPEHAAAPSAPSAPRSTEPQAKPVPSVMERLAKSAAGATDARGSGASTLMQTTAPSGAVGNRDAGRQGANPPGGEAGRRTSALPGNDPGGGLVPPATTRAAPAPASLPAPAPAATTSDIPVAAAPASTSKPAPVFVEVWGVNAREAKTYLSDLIMSLEKPTRARRNNTYLSEMNVKGSLLQPALQLMKRFPDVAVEQMNWNDSQRPGALNLQGMVTVRARNPDTGEARQVNFRLNAEFWGTRDGTVMASLSLREDD
jgi:DnaJ domain